MPTGRRDLNRHLPPFKISLVHRQRDLPKTYVLTLTADSFLLYALIDIRGDYSPYVLKGPFEATDPGSYVPCFPLVLGAPLLKLTQ